MIGFILKDDHVKSCIGLRRHDRYTQKGFQDLARAQRISSQNEERVAKL